MSKLITNNIKLFNVDQFIESFTEPGFNNYYFYLGRPTPYPQDSAPPTLYDNVQTTLIDSYDYMICGKRITSSDVVQMAPRHDWVANTAYEKYTHDNPELFSSNFYACVNEGSSYSVFKCLDNANGAMSTDAPSASETSAADDFYFTSDGYQWKYMYSITSSQFQKFATSSHIPVFVNSNVVGNAVSGSIDNIEVVSGGSGYASYTSGVFQETRVGGDPLVYALDASSASSNSNFYVNCSLKVTSGVGSGQQKKILGYTVVGGTRRVTIDSPFEVTPTTASGYEITPLATVIGDGTGATARAIVNATSNSIYRIEIVERGQNYTYATVAVTGNTGVINVSSNSTVVTNSAVVKVMLSPKGGHGSNAAAELGARYAGISVEFDSAQSGGRVLDTNDFRVVGILKDPLFANVVLNVSNSTGTFADGELVTQSQGAPVAGIVVTKPGSGYTSSPLVTITGTSITQATANATANSTGRVSSIEVINRGSGYITPSVTIASPPAKTFDANTNVSNSSSFITIANNVFQNNDIVRYLVAAGNTPVGGLANNTLYYVVQANTTGVKLSSSLNGSAISLTAGVTELGHSLTGETAEAAVIVDSYKMTTARGTVYSANDSVVKLTNAYGYFVTGNNSVSVLYGETSGFTAVCDTVTQPSLYFDQTYKVVGSFQTAQQFTEDELVVQGTNGNGYLYYSNTSVARLVNKKGVINQSDIETSYYINGSNSAAQFLVSGVVPADLVHGSGDVIYTENFTPITKSPGQTETIKLVLEF